MGILRDGKYYLCLNQIDPGAGWQPYANYQQCDVAIINPQTDVVEKVVSETTTKTHLPYPAQWRNAKECSSPMKQVIFIWLPQAILGILRTIPNAVFSAFPKAVLSLIAANRGTSPLPPSQALVTSLPACITVSI